MTDSEIEFFDMLAPEWDNNEVRSTPQRINHILDLISIDRGMDILDLGTGTGVLMPYLSQRVGVDGKILGVDLSDGMLEIAKRKYGSLNNVEFLKIDFEEQIIPGNYDIALLYSVYPHLHYPKDTIDWLFKMNIKPGGKIIIAFPSDEKFINEIHHSRGADSDCLPEASELSKTISGWGYEAKVVEDSEDAYVISVCNLATGVR